MDVLTEGANAYGDVRQALRFGMRVQKGCLLMVVCITTVSKQGKTKTPITHWTDKAGKLPNGGSPERRRVCSQQKVLYNSHG